MEHRIFLKRKEGRAPHGQKALIVKTKKKQKKKKVVPPTGNAARGGVEHILLAGPYAD